MKTVAPSSFTPYLEIRQGIGMYGKTQMMTTQHPPVSDSADDEETLRDTLNQVLNCLRNMGVVAE